MDLWIFVTGRLADSALLEDVAPENNMFQTSLVTEKKVQKMREDVTPYNLVGGWTNPFEKILYR